MTKKPCRHFLRGRCNLGATCKFAHPPELFGTQRGEDSPEKRGTRPCRHWARGHCSLGNKCSFKHGDKPASEHPPGSTTNMNPSANFSAPGGTEAVGMKRKFAPDFTGESSTKK